MHFLSWTYFTWTVNYEFVLLFEKHGFNLPNHSGSLKLTLTNTHTHQLLTLIPLIQIARWKARKFPHFHSLNSLHEYSKHSKRVVDHQGRPFTPDHLTIQGFSASHEFGFAVPFYQYLVSPFLKDVHVYAVLGQQVVDVNATSLSISSGPSDRLNHCRLIIILCLGVHR